MILYMIYNKNEKDFKESVEIQVITNDIYSFYVNIFYYLCGVMRGTCILVKIVTGFSIFTLCQIYNDSNQL
jgi:hypothetical protein